MLTETPNNKEEEIILGNTIHLGVLSVFDCRGVQTIKKAHTIKMIVDMEQHLPKPYGRDKTIIKSNVTKAFYKLTEQIYLETVHWVLV